MTTKPCREGGQILSESIYCYNHNLTSSDSNRGGWRLLPEFLGAGLVQESTNLFDICYHIIQFSIFTLLHDYYTLLQTYYFILSQVIITYYYIIKSLLRHNYKVFYTVVSLLTCYHKPILTYSYTFIKHIITSLFHYYYTRVIIR